MRSFKYILGEGKQLLQSIMGKMGYLIAITLIVRYVGVPVYAMNVLRGMNMTIDASKIVCNKAKVVRIVKYK